MSITYFDTIDSTNLYLKENYEKYNNLDCVLARHQTNGRGRMGRVWIDQDDLLMSILVKEEVQEKEKLRLVYYYLRQHMSYSHVLRLTLSYHLNFTHTAQVELLK